MDATVSAERGNEAKERRSVGERIRHSAAARTAIGIALVVIPSVAALVTLEQFYLTVLGPDWPYSRASTIVAPVILAFVVYGPTSCTPVSSIPRGRVTCGVKTLDVTYWSERFSVVVCSQQHSL